LHARGVFICGASIDGNGNGAMMRGNNWWQRQRRFILSFVLNKASEWQMEVQLDECRKSIH
jgi:hypothetical protein